MIVPGSVNPLLMAGGRDITPCGGSAPVIPTNGYVIKNSLRFRKSASANLNKTLPSTSSRRRWTVSTWVKLGALNSQFYIMCGISAMAQNGLRTYIRLNDDGHLYTEQGNIQINTHYSLTSNRVFRDPSAWYHLVCVFDSDNATASERVRIWVNGVRETLTGTFANQNVDSAIDYSWDHFIGRMWDSRLGDFWTDGYLADYKFISDTALDATSFGEFDSNNVWRPKAYAGTYGTNGFWLKFDDAAQIGKDSSGNNNHWTANNIDVAAPGTQATYDLMKDSPVMFDDGTANPPGNYATWNPLALGGTNITVSNGNLTAAQTAVTSGDMRYGSIGVSSGKYYWEVSVEALTVAANKTYLYMGVSDETRSNKVFYTGSDEPSQAGYKLVAINGATSFTPYGANYAAGSVIGIAIDCDNKTVNFYNNGTTQGAISYTTATTYFPFYTTDGNPSSTVKLAANFGQRPFKYAPPAGFKALCTTNLPTPSITNGKQHFDIALGAGAGILAQAQALTAKDLIWIKDRANSNNHQLIDVVRGANALHSNDALAESAYVAPSGNSVAWTWKAGGAPVNNTDGTIASQVSVNKCGGFSIVKWLGNGGVNATVGHGLGAAPAFIITKNLNNSPSDWMIYHVSLTNNYSISLSSASPQSNSSTWYGTNAPTSLAFYVSYVGNLSINVSSNNFVSYCWMSIPGMSAFDSYVGNGSADGAFVYCGFKPKFILIKDIGNTADWRIIDASRSTFNVSRDDLYPSSTHAEAVNDSFDILSNGFKLRAALPGINVSGAKYLYAAFAEHPFKIANAR